MLSQSVFPMPMTELYNPAALDMEFPDLLKECEKVFDSIKVISITMSITITTSCAPVNLSILLMIQVMPEQVAKLETETRGQSSSKSWFLHRADCLLSVAVTLLPFWLLQTHQCLLTSNINHIHMHICLTGKTRLHVFIFYSVYFSLLVSQLQSSATLLIWGFGQPHSPSSNLVPSWDQCCHTRELA